MDSDPAEAADHARPLEHAEKAPGGALYEGAPRPAGDQDEEAATRAHRAHLISFFDLVAPEYDAWAGGVRDRVARRLVELAEPQPGQVSLDIGTGTGLVAHRVARLVAPTSVYAIDLSQAMLQHARAPMLPNLELMVMAAEDLWFRGGFFDLVTICDTLPYLRDPVEALSEAHRVLRPGGTIAIASPRRSLNTTAQEAFFRSMSVLAERHPYLKVPGYPGIRPRYGEPEVLRTTLEAHGFTDIHLTDLVTGARATSADSFFDLMAGAGPRPHILVRTLGPTLRGRLAAELEPEIASAGEEGWSYHHAFLFATARRPR